MNLQHDYYMNDIRTQLDHCNMRFHDISPTSDIALLLRISEKLFGLVVEARTDADRAGDVLLESMRERSKLIADHVEAEHALETLYYDLIKCFKNDWKPLTREVRDINVTPR